MRAKPVLGEKAWFGPRSLGWGWAPLSWEGWALVVGALAVMSIGGGLGGTVGGAVSLWGGLAAVGLGVALKGTSPGGREARRKVQAAIRANPTEPDDDADLRRFIVGACEVGPGLHATEAELLDAWSAFTHQRLGVDDRGDLVDRLRAAGFTTHRSEDFWQDLREGGPVVEGLRPRAAPPS